MGVNATMLGSEGSPTSKFSANFLQPVRLTLEPCIPLPDRFLAFSGIPAWKRLIDRPLAKDERILLIADIFSDRDETESVKDLSGDNAQSFIDVADEVLLRSHPRRIGPLT